MNLYAFDISACRPRVCGHGEILLNQPEIRLYLPFSDWFETANGQCPFTVQNQPENGKYNLISGWFNKISKRFLCVHGD